MVPETFTSLYKISGVKGIAASSQAVGEFQNADFGEGYSLPDLETFKTNVGLSFPNPINVRRSLTHSCARARGAWGRALR